MRLIKYSFIALAAGLASFLVSYFAAARLEQSKSFSFPESIVRHYGQVSGRVFDGELGGRQAVEFKKTVPIDSSAGVTNGIETVEIETTAVDIELLPSETDSVEVELSSNRVDPENPVLIDDTRGRTVRILTQEGQADTSLRRSWMSLDFGDSKPIRKNALTVRIPKSITNVLVRTTSGESRLATALKALHVQSKSGDMRIATMDNPLARVENLTVETVSGDLIGPGRFDQLRFNSVSGDIELSSFDRVLEINAQSVSGDLTIKGAELVDANVEFATKSGAVEIDKEISPAMGLAIKGGLPAARKNSVFTLGSGSANVKFKTISGDLKFERSGPDDDLLDDRDDDESNDDSASLLDPVSPRSNFQARKTRVVADETFLICVARAAIREGSKLGGGSAKRCVRVIV